MRRASSAMQAGPQCPGDGPVPVEAAGDLLATPAVIKALGGIVMRAVQVIYWETGSRHLLGSC